MRAELFRRLRQHQGHIISCDEAGDIMGIVHARFEVDEVQLLLAFGVVADSLGVDVGPE